MLKYLLPIVFLMLAAPVCAQINPGGGGGSGTITGVTAGTGLTGGGTSGTVTLNANIGTSGATIPLLNGTNTWSGVNTFGSGDLTATSPTFTTPSLGVASATSLNFGGGALSTYATGAWTPADNSGAALTFTAVKAGYTQIGTFVYSYFTVTYPSTASAANAAISGFPVVAGSTNFGGGGGFCDGSNVAGTPVEFFLNAGASNGFFALLTNNTNVTNVQLSTATVRCTILYSTV